ADGKPRYVLDVKPETRQVVVGAAELLSTRTLIASDVVPFEDLDKGREVEAQIRAHGEAIGGVITSVEAGREGEAEIASVSVELARPIRGVAPGQTLVLYAGDRVLASATLDARA
ncbi:MAG: aminomethyltransferase beta-barrel domain-containing protein, partial [Dermabacter sp.]|nr:aminomethyltransferase beta-barrel domain-containing protein [Dermabacter sp.]